eukprot:5308318-Pyramimonas_sp.AAC.1
MSAPSCRVCVFLSLVCDCRTSCDKCNMRLHNTAHDRTGTALAYYFSCLWGGPLVPRRSAPQLKPTRRLVSTKTSLLSKPFARIIFLIQRRYIDWSRVLTAHPFLLPRPSFARRRHTPFGGWVDAAILNSDKPC